MEADQSVAGSNLGFTNNFFFFFFIKNVLSWFRTRSFMLRAKITLEKHPEGGWDAAFSTSQGTKSTFPGCINHVVHLLKSTPRVEFRLISEGGKAPSKVDFFPSVDSAALRNKGHANQTKYTRIFTYTTKSQKGLIFKSSYAKRYN